MKPRKRRHATSLRDLDPLKAKRDGFRIAANWLRSEIRPATKAMEVAALDHCEHRLLFEAYSLDNIIKRVTKALRRRDRLLRKTRGRK